MTINGSHTMAETQQLIDAKGALIHQISDAFVRSGWTGPAAEAWRRDWLVFNQRWDAMKKSVSRAFVIKSTMTPGLPANVVPAEDQWQQVLRAINVSGTGLYTKGDLPDLQQRLTNAIGAFVDESKIPKQDSWDADLAGYIQSDKDAKAIEAASKAARDAAGGISNPLNPKFPGTNVPVSTGLLVGIGAAVVAATVLLVKAFSVPSPSGSKRMK